MTTISYAHTGSWSLFFTRWWPSRPLSWGCTPCGSSLLNDTRTTPVPQLASSNCCLSRYEVLWGTLSAFSISKWARIAIYKPESLCEWAQALGSSSHAFWRIYSVPLPRYCWLVQEQFIQALYPIDFRDCISDSPSCLSSSKQSIASDEEGLLTDRSSGRPLCCRNTTD